MSKPSDKVAIVRQEKFTHRAQAALADAQSLALGADHTQVEAAHLLAVLLDAEDKLAASLIGRAGGQLIFCV